MILPASYCNGFAPRDGQPLYPELWRGCVGAWAPCLGPTGLTLRDWSRFGVHGTLTNGAVFAPSLGQYAIDLDGTNDYCVVRYNFASYPLFNEMTGDKLVCAWVKTSSPGASYRTVFSKDKTFALTIKAGVFITYDWAGGGDKSSGVNVADGRWHHLAVSVKAGAASGSQLYIDGLPAGAAFTYLTQSGNALNDISIGTGFDATNNPASEYVAAGVDDVRAYNRFCPEIVKTLASRRGIAYEMAPRRRSSSAVQFNRRRRLLLGST